MPEKSYLLKLKMLRSSPNLIILTFIIIGATILILIGSITLTDLTKSNKDIGTIFTNSRVVESISLGIGFTLMHYLVIGMAFLAAGIVLFFRNKTLTTLPKQKTEKIPINKNNKKQRNSLTNKDKFSSECFHHFGYLSNRPKDSPVPQECMICQHLGNCMVATVFPKK